MSNIGIALTIIGIVSMISAYFLYKNTPKIDNHHKMQNPDKQFILTYLNSLGFDDTDKKGFGGHNRLTHDEITKGSLYVGNEYISGTGSYTKIKEKISPSSFDRHDYPEWREHKVLQLLEYLESSFLQTKD